MNTEPASITPESSKPQRVQTLSELSKLSRKPKLVGFMFGEQRVEFEVRALSQVEWAKVSEIGADVKPPQKFKDAARKEPDGYDYEDAEYLKKAKEVYRLRQAAAIDLVWEDREGIPTEGDTLEDKAKWLDENLPPALTDLLYTSIRQLTTDATQLATFTSAAG